MGASYYSQTPDPGRDGGTGSGIRDSASGVRPGIPETGILLSATGFSKVLVQNPGSRAWGLGGWGPVRTPSLRDPGLGIRDLDWMRDRYRGHESSFRVSEPEIMGIGSVWGQAGPENGTGTELLSPARPSRVPSPGSRV